MANRRFEMYEYRQIIQRLRLGDTDREVARTLRVGRPKVKQLRALARERGWLEPVGAVPEEAVLAAALKPATPPRASNVSSVEPWRERVLLWHTQGVQATTIRAALAREHGFQGSVHAIYRFLEREAPNLPTPTVILEFDPGEMLQVDFGKGPEITDRASGEVFGTWIFVATLAWSRHQYAEIVRDQRVETWLACHRRAFEWFNGVPAKVRIDNPKCAITRACYYEPEVQRSYRQLAEGYGFTIDPCPVADPKKKGRVESGVKYVKRSFVPLRQFHSLEHANEQLRAWVMGEAGNRVHGTTHERPLSLFDQTERAMLQPLPAIAPECPVWLKATLQTNCHLVVQKCLYSAPYPLIGQVLWVELAPQMVRVYREHELVAVHPRKFRPGDRSTVEEHLPPHARAYLMRDPQWCLKQAAGVGPACLAVVEALFADRVLEHLRAAQGLLRLREEFGVRRLEAACSRALNFGTPGFRSVKQILHAGLDLQPELLPASTLDEAYLGTSRFSRTTH